MIVFDGPFTLTTSITLSTTARFFVPHGSVTTPTAYTPFVTFTLSPSLAASTAFWMFVAAVTQLV